MPSSQIQHRPIRTACKITHYWVFQSYSENSVKNEIVAGANFLKERLEMNPQELIYEIAAALVDKPDEVKVNVIEGTQSTLIELEVAKEDTGKIIGKKGQTANAIRTILNAVAAKNRHPFMIEIVD